MRRKDLRIGLAVLLLLLLAFGAWHFFLKPPSEPESTGELLVPRELAGQFKLKGAEQVLEYCRDKIRPASYEGILRGAHGALWAGEANAWDRVLLAAEALRGIDLETRIVPGDPPRLAYKDGKDGKWNVVRLDNNSAAETMDNPPAEAVEPEQLAERSELLHFLMPVLVVVTEDGKAQRIAAEKPERLAEWVAQPVLLAAHGKEDDVRYTLRIGEREVLKTGPLGKARRSVLELTWKMGNRPRAVWQRELFDKRNAAPEIPGQAAPHPGDRYAVVIAAGPLVPEVLKTREKMLASEKYTFVKDELERDLVFLGAKYQVDSDANTKALIERTKVEVGWTTPRITIVAAEGKNRATSIDVVEDRVEATGKTSREFHTARGLANDTIETRTLFEVAKRPVISASTVLSHFKSKSADTPERRLAAIAREAQRLLKEEPIGTQVKLQALPPRGAPADEESKALAADPPTLFIERGPQGLLVHGVEESAKPKNDKGAEPFLWNTKQSASFGTDAVRLALAADGVLARQAQRPNYHLGLDVLSGWPTEPIPITAGSVLNYRAAHDGKNYNVHVLVALNAGVPGGVWFTMPEGSEWVDLFPRQGPRIGEIGGRWPHVLNTTPIGPGVESFLAPAGSAAQGEGVKHTLLIANERRVVQAMKVPLPPVSDLVEAKVGDVWHAAALMRSSGLIERKNDTYRVHFLGEEPRKEDWLTRNQLRPLDPVEIEVGGQYRLGNALKDPKDRPNDDTMLIHLCGQPESKTHKVFARQGDPKRQAPAGNPSFRSVRLIEAQTGGKWRPAQLLESQGDKHRVRTWDGKAGKEEWLPPDRIRRWEDIPDKNAYAVILPSGQLPLLLEWQDGKNRLSLNVAGPVVVGRVRDRDNGLPIVDAEVSRPQGKGKVRTAGDGSFALHLDDPLFPLVTFILRGRALPQNLANWKHPAIREPMERRVVVMVDQSEGMTYGLDPESTAAAGPGKQRQDALRRDVKTFLTRLLAPQDSNRVLLWSYAADAKPKGSIDDPSLVKQHGDYSGAGQVVSSLEKMKPGGAAPLSAVLLKLGELEKKKTLPADAVAVLFTSGRNDSKKTPAQAYRESKVRVPVHIFGFGIKPGSEAEKQLLELAAISGGSFRATDPKAPYALEMGSFRTRVGDFPIHVGAECYLPRTLTLPIAEVGREKLDLQLDHECQCKHKTEPKPKRLLTITNKNVGDLAHCDGLSPRARDMIAKRVKDGAWTVTIPNQRVNIASVSAYGWFETEKATGRLIGRTEDGLHGSSADAGNWPTFDPYKTPGFKQAASQQPFVVWYQGIVSYTSGSVLAAMDWHRQPGFLNGTPEDFKRFVQANALDFSAAWWDEVGSGAFGQFANNYWSGVCLNFTLQSAALGLPSDGCFRRWAENLCNRAANAVKEAGPGIVDKALNDLLEDRFGEEKASLVRRAIDFGFKDLANDLNQWWGAGVRQGFNCQRFRGVPSGAGVSKGK